METYLNHAPCIYFSSKDDGSVIEVNDTLCNKLGFTKQELTGKKIDEIFTLATRIFQQTHFFPLLKMQGHAEEIFITLQTKEKDHIPVLINAERTIVNNEPITIHIGIVVHNRKKFEDELVAARKAAETALHQNTDLIKAKQELQLHLEHLDQQIDLVKNQNAELKQFNRVITHDLQEPLRKLSVFSNMLFDNTKKDAQVKNVEKLMQVSEQMRSTLSGLQQYVWLTENPPAITEVDLNKIIKEVHQQLEKDFPRINLFIEGEHLPTIDADKEQMYILFYQLFSNAIRFKKNTENATVILSANTLMLNSFFSIKEKYKYKEFLKLQVKDNGIGFDAQYKDQVFEIFKRLHKGSGRGVGLSLSKKIAESHNGNISIDSVEGKGTIVTVFLPLKQNG